MDIVCRHEDVLVFVEVKTRASLRHGRPAEAVNAAKQALIARGGLAWLRMLHNPDVFWRFDIVEVVIEPDVPPAFEVIQNAFSLPDPYIY